MRPAPDLVLGDRYVLVRRIAIGGMGEVWEATDTILGRAVAIKVLKEEFRTTPEFIGRFRGEARHAAGLSHPGIASVYDYGESDDIAYLVMELVPGRTLSELLVEQPHLPTAVKLSILSQAAEALHAAHLAGVIHRDVKPANLMVRPDATVKVTDFGIARAKAAASLTDAGQVVGTAGYMSPEQATGGAATAASDVYALGVIAYEMFAGRPPFERESSLAVAMAHVQDAPPPLPSAVPRGIAELIMWSLAKDPSERPQSAAAFAARARREMAAIAAPPPPPAAERTEAAERTTVTPAHAVVAAAGAVAPTVPVQRAPVSSASRRFIPERPRSRRSASVLAGIVALALLVGGVVWALASRSTDGSADPGPTVPAVTGSDPVAVTGPSSAPVVPADPAAAGDDVDAPAVVTEPPAPAPPATASPDTVPPATAAPTTAAPATAPPATFPPATVPPATAPPTTAPRATIPPTTPPPATAPAPTAPPAPAAPAPGGVAPIEEDEAIDFVRSYYDEVRRGNHEAGWATLTPEFRAARNLTFERYSRYWQNTSLELDNLRFTPGPGSDQGRVRFDARYTIGERVVEETDEILLRREGDGRIVIVDQRIV
jgi:serine/threonine-protein kinase